MERYKTRRTEKSLFCCLRGNLYLKIRMILPRPTGTENQVFGQSELFDLSPRELFRNSSSEFKIAHPIKLPEKVIGTISQGE